MPAVKRRSDGTMYRAKKLRTYRRTTRQRALAARRVPRNVGTRLGVAMGFPKKLKFKHKYVDQLTITSTAGIQQNYFFSCNGMYDPDITGIGHQPLYFDQIDAIYNHYHVIGSKIRFTVIPVGTTATVPHAILVYIDDDSTATAGMPALMEQPGTITKYCAGGINPDKLYITKKWSAKKAFGNVMANDQLQGDAAANPSEQQYYHFALRAVDNISTVSVNVLVEIEYIAIWNERREINRS